VAPKRTIASTRYSPFFYTDKQPFFITNLVLGTHLFQRCRRGS
jgi:hypothetical protein